MKGHIDNRFGSIQIEPEVIALYAGTTAVECFGIVGMAAVSVKDGFARLLKRESLTKGINVAIRENVISIDFYVIVSYGVSILAVADNLMESVKYKVEDLTGMNCLVFFVKHCYFLLYFWFYFCFFYICFQFLRTPSIMLLKL